MIKAEKTHEFKNNLANISKYIIAFTLLEKMDGNYIDRFDTALGSLRQQNIDYLQQTYDLFEFEKENLPLKMKEYHDTRSNKIRKSEDARFVIAKKEAKTSLRMLGYHYPAVDDLVGFMRTGVFKEENPAISFHYIRERVNENKDTIVEYANKQKS